MAWDDELNGIHYEIAASEARHIAVLAGPGTGKTSYGLMRRVARLLEEGTPGNQILLISFTRTAAHDLHAKIDKLGVPGSGSVKATTLHSYCFEILARDSIIEMTRRVPRPLLEHEVILLLRDIEVGPAGLTDRRESLNAFVAGWARGKFDHPGLAELPEDRKFEDEVRRWLMHHRAMHIGEVVPMAYELIRTDPAHPERSRFSHIIVDEYQDLNVIEQRLLDLLSSNGSLCVAGDDDQSIYGFRYADPSGIRAQYNSPESQSFEINVCGRCPEAILSIANSLIQQEAERAKGPLTSNQPDPGNLAIVQWDSLDHEVEGIASAISFDISNSRFEAGDILVLVNRQAIGERLRRRLDELNVPAHSFFSQECLNTNEAREGLALLRELVTEDPVSLRVLLGLGDNTGRRDAYQKLRQFADQANKTERQILDEAVRGVKLPFRIPALIERYKSAKEKLASLPSDDLPALVDALFPPDSITTAEIRQVAQQALVSAESLKDLVDEIVERVSQHDVPESPDFVRIMSLHKSKGLTSPSVIVMSALDGIIPTLFGAKTESEIRKMTDEQRRLMYVAITRSSHQLIISYFREIDYGLANRLGMRTERVGNHRHNGSLRTRTLATPYLRELGRTAPEPLRGIEWLDSYTALPVKKGASADDKCFA